MPIWLVSFHWDNNSLLIKLKQKFRLSSTFEYYQLIGIGCTEFYFFRVQSNFKFANGILETFLMSIVLHNVFYIWSLIIKSISLFPVGLGDTSTDVLLLFNVQWFCSLFPVERHHWMQLRQDLRKRTEVAVISVLLTLNIFIRFYLWFCSASELLPWIGFIRRLLRFTWAVYDCGKLILCQFWYSRQLLD